jgi:RHS repeat-associated protein
MSRAITLPLLGSSRVDDRHRRGRRRARYPRLERLESRQLLAQDLVITRLSPQGVGHPFEALLVQFNQPLQEGTFQVEDVTIAGPGAPAVGSITRLASDQYQLTLSGLAPSETFHLGIGPDILDTDGAPLNQDRDTTPGEPGDTYRAVLSAGALTIPETDSTYDGQALLLFGNTAVIDGTHSFDSVEVLGGATVRHSEATATAESRIDWHLAGDLWVDATSAINVSGRGYQSGYTLGNTTDGGATGWSAGTYGGYGYSYSGATNAAYGDYRDPAELGSGGRNDNHPNAAPGGPGAGGGLVRITAASAAIDGAIRAGGNTGWNWDGHGGGGAGGGIYLSVGTLSGAGTIEADGGPNNGGPSGGGGGGRVALYYDQATFDFATQVSADSGAGGGGHGGVGTVYTKDNQGEGVLRIDSHGKSAGVWTPLGVAGDTQFEADRLIVRGAGVVVAPEHQMPVLANNVEIAAGAVLTTRATDPTQEYSLLLTIAQALTVDAASAIDVTGRGYQGNRTLGNTTIGGATGWEAGSYGGIGSGVSSIAALYGSAEFPAELGSGGSNANHLNPGPGGPGAGGGLVQIRAASAAIDGAIRAGGNTGWGWDGWGGGGSGGGILLNVGTLSGTGVIMAPGGGTPGGPGGGGGGGRIAVYTWGTDGVTLPTTNITAAGGTGGGGNGQAGTVVFSQAPTFFWRTPETLFHGSQTLAWEALGVDPVTVGVDLTAYQGTQAYPLAVNRPASGSITWDTAAVPDGSYVIRVVFHDAQGQEVGTLNRAVGVNNAAAWHGGAIAADTVWAADRVHIVTETVTVQAGATLTIEPGAIVKFVPGANLRLIIQDGGTLNAVALPDAAIVLTSLADDSVGGDTNYDQAQTTPRPRDWYGFQLEAGGTQNLSPFVQERYQFLNVAAVTWQGGLSHETINGASTLLAAVVKHDQYPLTYTWDFGDGSEPVSGTIADQAAAYNVETTHVYPDSGPGTPYVATLTITDPSGNVSSDQYPVVVRGDSLTIQRNIAIDRGLWWLHKQLRRSGEDVGYWTEGGYYVALTGSNVLAFENNGHLPNGDPLSDPYVEDVTRGLNFLFTQMVPQPLDPAQSPHGDPDTNGNGIGISINSSRYTYEIGPAMMAVAASTTPEAIVQAGPANVVGRTYRDVLTDMVDMCAWGQNEAGNGRGGWRYAWNSGDSDNSVTQWPILGIEAAEANWGIAPPEFVKRELELFLTWSQDASGGWGYDGPYGSNNFAHAGAAIAGLAYSGYDATDSRIAKGLAWMDANWNASTYGGTIWDNKYAMYAVAKGLRTINPAITMVGQHDWYAEFSRDLIARQGPDGNWPITSPWTSGPSLDTAFSILVLEPSVLTRPPVAVLDIAPLAAPPGQVFTFDASGSYHLDTTRKIVEYSFNFGDGTSYTETADNAPDGLFDGRATHVYPDTVEDLSGMPGQRRDYIVTMTVRDDDPRGSKTDEAHQTITLSLTNHPPVADPGGPYVAYVGVPLTLTGINSYDPDTGDPLYNHIAAYGWQLTSQAPYQFNDATTVATNWTWNTPGTYNVGVKVTDRFGASTVAWTTVEVRTGIPTTMFVRPERKADYQTILDVMAQLTTPTGAPIVGMPVDFYVDRNRDGSYDPAQEFAGEAITGDDGWATLPLTQALAPAVYGLEAVFAGQGDYFTSSDRDVIEVRQARTAVFYTGDTTGGGGQPIRLSAILSDYLGTPIADSPLTFTIGDWSIVAQTDARGVGAAQVDPAQAAGASTVSVAFAGDSNRRPSSDAAPFAILSLLSAPVLDPVPDQALNQGGTLALAGGFTDPDLGQTHVVTIDWGDGSTAETLSLAPELRTFTASHLFVDEGRYHATVAVQDEDGRDVKSFLIDVADLPVIATGGFTLRAMQGEALVDAAVATFVDPGGPEPTPSDPDPVLGHHYPTTIAWGDGSTSAGVIERTGDTFSVRGGHMYAAEGTYTITVTIAHHETSPAVAVSTAMVGLPAGILLLDPTRSGSLMVAHTGRVTLRDEGSIVVDSSSKHAIKMNARSTITASMMEVVGGMKISKAAKLEAPVRKTTAVADPMTLSLPAAPSLIHGRVRYALRATRTLDPGTYVGGIHVTGRGKVHLNPGVYYMKGGGFKVTGRGSVTGEGVVIINAPRKAHDAIRFSNRAVVNLSAAKSLPAPYAACAGLALFQDPASRVQIKVSDHAAVSIDGQVYAPRAALVIRNMKTWSSGPAASMVVEVDEASSLAPEIVLYSLRANGRAILNVGYPADSRSEAAAPATRVDGRSLDSVPRGLGPDPAAHQESPLAQAASVRTTSVFVTAAMDAVVTVSSLTTNNNRPTLTGSATPGPGTTISGVTVAVGGQTLAATLDGTTWSVAVPSSLTDGTHDVVATATDGAGHTAQDATTGELIVDTVAPGPTMRRIVANTATPTLSGLVIELSPSSGIAGATVTISGQTVPATFDGRRWAATLPAPLPDGTYVAVVTATDQAGNSATFTPNTPAYDMVHYITIDTASPLVTVAGLITNAPTPTLTGTVTDSMPSSGITGVTVTVGGQTITAALRGGTWSATLPTPLADGIYEVQATATDTAGNAARDATSQELTIYTGRPVVTVDPLIADTSQPLLTGTVASLSPDVGIAAVQVAVGSQTLPATVVGDTWYVVPDSLADGIYDVQATALDAAGNRAGDTTANELRVITGAPVVTVAAMITNNSAPTLSGTVNDPTAEVTLVVGGQSLATTVDDITWTAAIPAPLADGTYDVEVTARNLAGLTGQDTTTDELTIDTVRPAVAVAALTTNINQPMLGGTLSDAAPSSGIAGVTVAVGGQTFAATVAGNTWGATVPAALADGTYDIRLTITDRAGNSTEDLALNALIVDTAGPLVSVAPQVTNDAIPTLHGTVSDPVPGSGLASVSIVVAGQTFVATVTGSDWSVAIPDALPDGRYDVQVTATDRAFNTGHDTTIDELVIDTADPVVTIDTLITTITTPTLHGTVSDPVPGSGLASVSIVVAGQTLTASVAGNAWSAAVPVGLGEGVYDVSATATDRAGNATTTTGAGALTIGRVPPVLQPIPDQTVIEGQTLTVQAVASDPVEPPPQLTFSLDAAPQGATIDPATGLFTWTPTSSPQAVGVTIRVSDDGTPALSATQSFTIIVNPPAVNHDPFFTSTPPTQVTAGNAYSYLAQATDPDGDPLTYSLIVAPQGMTIKATTGAIAWTPGIGAIGEVPVTVRVADGRGGSVEQPYTLTVLADTDAPQVTLLVSPNPANVGDEVTITVSATDNVAVASLGLTVAGQPVALDANGSATIQAAAIGRVALVGSATDAAGNVGTDGTDLVVRDASDQTPPTVALVTPAAGDQISAPIAVIGTADDPQLVSYQLEVARVFGGTWQTMFVGTTSVVNGTLGVFDPSILPNDSYILRLSAVDANGNEKSVETTVDVTGNLKLGNFRLAFTDLSIPVTGIPITVMRTYDTMTIGSNGGDFGPGWSLEFRDADLRTNVPWTGQPTEGTYPPFFEGARVYVTLPGGVREGFTFNPVGPFFPFSLYRPAFVPDPGVTSTLTVDDINLSRFGNEYYTFPDQAPYNPADTGYSSGTYTLTTKDGTQYVINGNTFKLDRVSDRNGNSLTFTDAAITSSAGPRVTFTRDGQGRITSVTDPMGQQIHYTYDANGDLATVTDRDGNVTQFFYHPARPHYLDHVIDPSGNTGLRTEYDDQGRLLKAIDAAGKSIEVAYDPANLLQTVTDALGNPTTYEYDARGNIVTEVDALGGVTRRTYDANDNLLTLTDPLGHVWSYTYDGQRNVLTKTDPLRHTTTYTYNGFGQILTETDPLGHTRTATYDGAGNPLTSTDEVGTTTTFTYAAGGNLASIANSLGTTIYEYDSRGNRVLSSDRLGNPTTYTYDGASNPLSMSYTWTTPQGPRDFTAFTEYDHSGRVVKTIDTEGGVTITEYDARGLRSAVIDPLGQRTEYVYNDRGDLTRVTFADGTSESYLYDDARQRIATIDRAGRVTRYVFDALGRVAAVIYPDDTPGDDDNPRSSSEFDAAGRVIAEIDPRGNRTEYEYDDAGRRTLMRDARGHETLYEYDAADRVTAMTDPLGRRTTYTYDELDRLTRTDFPDGTWTVATYDIEGNAITKTDQNGRTTHFEYDAMSQLTAVVDARGARTEYEYDEGGNLVAQRDANGHVTRYEYDGIGRRNATVLPLGQRSTAVYNATGEMTASIDFNGDTTHFTYDTNHWLTRQEYPDGSFVAYTYTATGRMQTVTDARGVTAYAYDARDRLLARTDPDGRMIRYTYDLAGNRTSIEVPSGTTTYTYDTLNRPEAVTDPDGDVTSYEYDALSQLVQTTFPNGTVETREYDTLGRLTFLQNTGPGGVLSSYRYTLDAAGNRLAVEENDGRRVEYIYDELDRLTGEQIFNPGATIASRTIDYTYDSVGNRLSRSDSAEWLTTYEYDANDRLRVETLSGNRTEYTYDDNGNLLSQRLDAVDQVLYEWDYENRLVAADTDADGTIDVTYRYDAQGNRVSETKAGDEVRYLVDANRPESQVIEEYTPGGLIDALYVHGLDLISQLRAATTGKSYYLVDGLGSTRALVNDAGVVTDRYLYDAFGRVLQQVGITPNSFLFAGEQRDSSLLLDYLRARYYDPRTGRFTARDTFAGALADPMSLNSYLYANANPVMHVDPSGHGLIVELAVAALISFVVAEALLRYGFRSATLSSGLELGRVGNELDWLGKQPVYKALEGSSSNCSAVENVIRRHLVGAGPWKTLKFVRVNEWISAGRMHHAVGIVKNGVDTYPLPDYMIDPIDTGTTGQLPTGPLHKRRVFDHFDWHFKASIVFGPIETVTAINLHRLAAPGIFLTGKEKWESWGRQPTPPS